MSYWQILCWVQIHHQQRWRQPVIGQASVSAHAPQHLIGRSRQEVQSEEIMWKYTVFCLCLYSCPICNVVPPWRLCCLFRITQEVKGWFWRILLDGWSAGWRVTSCFFFRFITRKWFSSHWVCVNRGTLNSNWCFKKKTVVVIECFGLQRRLDEDSWRMFWLKL